MKTEKMELEAKLKVDIVSVKDATYVMFKDGFHEDVIHVKHFNMSVSIDFSLVNREKKLAKILRQ